MKINFTILAVLLFAFTAAISQDQQKSKPKLPYNPGGDDRLVFEFTIDDWLDKPGNIKTKYLLSRGFGAKIFKEHLLGTSHFSFAYGLGFRSHNVSTNGIFTDTLNSTIMLPIERSYKINKTSFNYLDLPFELRFRSRPTGRGKSRFKLTTGFVVGVLLQDHIKYKDSDIGKIKTYRLPNRNKYHYGLTGRFGFGKINFTGYYSLVPLFKENKGPRLIPYSVGLSFSIF